MVTCHSVKDNDSDVPVLKKGFLPFNLRKKRAESRIPMNAGAADDQLNNTRRRDHFWSTCNKQHPQALITANTCEHEQTTERRPLFNHPPTNFEGCKQARDRRKTGCLPPPVRRQRRSAAPRLSVRCPLLPLSTLRRAEVAACARGIQPRSYGFFKDVHISQNQTKCCFFCICSGVQ